VQINFADEIFDVVPAYQILGAMHTAIRQHHAVLVDPGGPGYTKWVAICSSQLGDSDISYLISITLISSIFVDSQRYVEVVSTPSSLAQITFTELTESILRSFHIYVENGRADKRFIYALLTPELRRDLKEQEKIGAVTFESSGGITELARKIVDDDSARTKLSLRAFALFDSDALSPGVPSRDAKDAQRACKSVGVPFYCLERRAIENYIPENALSAYASTSNNAQTRINRVRIARAFGRLSVEQQSHFHMKDGFGAPHGQLYDDIAEQDRETLMTGFGSHLSSCYDEGGIANRACLETSTGWAELQKVIGSLMEVL